MLDEIINKDINEEVKNEIIKMPVFLIKNFVIKTKEDVELAGGYIKKIKAYQQRIRNFFLDIKEKIEAALKKIEEKENFYLDNLEKAEQVVRAQLNYFLNEIENPEDFCGKNVSFSEVLDFEIVDENAIKREFLVPDNKKIKNIVKAFSKQAEEIVGGIKIITRRYARIK